MKLAIFADCHGNLSALQACTRHLMAQSIPGVRVALLGDYVDYGPRPNETIAFLRDLDPLVVLRGNHEKAILDGEVGRFSSARGLASVAWTRDQLDRSSRDFLQVHDQGLLELTDEAGRRMLFVHGDFSDPFWGKMSDIEMQAPHYQGFDFVFSGHSHIPHFREFFSPSEDPVRRNRKKTVFLNPGSVGQPRNHCPMAQYLTFDTATEAAAFHKVTYDIRAEQALYDSGLDEFYCTRLEYGI